MLDETYLVISDNRIKMKKDGMGLVDVLSWTTCLRV